jgi:hypothetical protein
LLKNEDGFSVSHAIKERSVNGRIQGSRFRTVVKKPGSIRIVLYSVSIWILQHTGYAESILGACGFEYSLNQVV